MNTDQTLVSNHLTPLLSVCSFLDDFLKGRINFYSSRISQEPNNQTASALIMSKKLGKFTNAHARFLVIRTDAFQLKNELLDVPSLEQFSLDAVCPNFIQKTQKIRNQLMSILSVSPNFQ